MPTTGYSFPDTLSIAFSMFHDVSFNKVGRGAPLTKESPVLGESDSFVNGDVASDHVSGTELITISCPWTRSGK
jgi:hypothetical protein